MTTVIGASARLPGDAEPPLPTAAPARARTAYGAARTPPATTSAAPAGRWRTEPVRPSDAPALHALFAVCSPETIRLRFFGQVRALPEEYLEQALAGSPDRHDAVVAYARGGSRNRLIGLASLAAPTGNARDAGETAAELGLLVGDPWQRQGAGRAMLELLLARARARGVRRVTATVLPGRPALLGALGRHLPAAHLAYTADGPSGVYKLDRP
ncbi:GNAT family N-acetyltransferase [Streptomyces sp. NRRL F-5123]|uniref:GNAT family N-acetyltransferase n=1 Tax=Streptomyces sp. NRRL F-5123 TaxID=1463856 RepID=UPI0004E12CD0|nr:GNAT family N-acetyltransferase [Streptomyces sp. NRRL F-5123]